MCSKKGKKRYCTSNQDLLIIKHKGNFAKSQTRREEREESGGS